MVIYDQRCAFCDFSGYANDRRNLKKYESIANLQMTAITKIQIFSETIFLVITFYGNACDAYMEGRNAKVLITLLGTVCVNELTFACNCLRFEWQNTNIPTIKIQLDYASLT